VLNQELVVSNFLKNSLECLSGGSQAEVRGQRSGTVSSVQSDAVGFSQPTRKQTKEGKKDKTPFSHAILATF